MSLYTFYGFFLEHIIYFIAAIVQLILLLLPVALSKWEDDMLNGLMYVAVQTGLAALLFLVLPCFFSLPKASLWLQGGFIGATVLGAFFRAITHIPLEGLVPDAIKTLVIKDLNFSFFFTMERLNMLNTQENESPECELRYDKLREKLRRLKPSADRGSRSPEPYG